MAPPAAETVLFQAVCTPPRSLSRRGLRLLTGLLALLGGGAGLLFLLLGAWPIVPFLGLEVGFTLALVMIHVRGAGRMAEIVMLTSDRLVVARTDARGRREDVVLDPYWARAVHCPHPANAGVLRIESRGCGVEVGRHLGAEEKASLHKALAGALARARRPDFDNPQLR